MGEEESTRNSDICTLSEQGLTNTEIARRYGITRQRVCAILSRQAKQEESWRVRELRASYADLQEEVKKPPAQHSAIGKTITDPETGKLVRNAGVKISAARERRLTLAAMAKEQDRQQYDQAEQEQMMADIIGAFDEAYAETDRLKQENIMLRRQLSQYVSEDGQEIMPAQIVT